MHWIISHAYDNSPDCDQALQAINLPNLDTFVEQSYLSTRLEVPPTHLSMPHEIALAQAWGWKPSTMGHIPFAAQLAKADGIDIGTQVWGLLTPCYWHVERDFVVIQDPTNLALTSAESISLFDSIAPLFNEPQEILHYGAPMRWYLANDDLEAIQCASLDRVVGRNIAPWLCPRSSNQTLAIDNNLPSNPKTQSATQSLHRRQSEVQLLLYQHPVNVARQELNKPFVNSFWLSACGAYQEPLLDQATQSVQLIDILRPSALRQEWPAWARAWQELDELLATHVSKPEHFMITLCSENRAQTLSLHPQSKPLWRRLSKLFALKFGVPSAKNLLQSL